MKTLIRFLTGLSILGLAAGIIVLALGRAPLAGIIWVGAAVTAFAAYGAGRVLRERAAAGKREDT